MKPTLLILAAGMGSRYGGLKQIDPMGPDGETMLDYAVADAAGAGFGRIVFVIRRDIEQAFRQTVGARVPGGLRVDYVFQELDDLPPPFAAPAGRTKPWGTAHAVRSARGGIAEPFAVINADDFYGAGAYRGIAGWLANQDPSEPAVALVAYRLDRTLSEHGTVNRGVCSVGRGFLRGIEEIEEIGRDPDGVITGRNTRSGEPVRLDGSERVSMNFWGFSPAVFPLLEESFVRFLEDRVHEPKAEWYLPAVVDEWISGGLLRCPVIETDSPWFGVTYPADRDHVAESLRRLSPGG
ncbi:MAG: NDP-sugar synthase [Puniceicoccaceae bacterium]